MELILKQCCQLNAFTLKFQIYYCCSVCLFRFFDSFQICFFFSTPSANGSNSMHMEVIVNQARHGDSTGALFRETLVQQISAVAGKRCRVANDVLTGTLLFQKPARVFWIKAAVFAFRLLPSICAQLTGWVMYFGWRVCSVFLQCLMGLKGRSCSRRAPGGNSSPRPAAASWGSDDHRRRSQSPIVFTSADSPTLRCPSLLPCSPQNTPTHPCFLLLFALKSPVSHLSLRVYIWRPHPTAINPSK